MHPELARLAYRTKSRDINGSEQQGKKGVEAVEEEGGGTEVFRDWYGSEQMLRVSAALMGCEREVMQFGKPLLPFLLHL